MTFSPERISFGLLAALLIGAFAVGCGKASSPLTEVPDSPVVDSSVEPTITSLDVDSHIDPRTSGTEKMAERLRVLAQSANPNRTPSIAPIPRLASFRAQLEREQRPDQRVVLRSMVGWHALLVGETETAINEFAQVYAELDRLSLPPNHGFYKNLHELNGIANLRYAELQNCLANHTIDSCIMPMQGGGIHTLRTGALKARDEFLVMLQQDPEAARPRWLLNLTYMVLGEYPDKVPLQWLIPPAAFASDFDIKRFEDVAGSVGVDMIGLSGGVISDDFNGDYLLDVVASDWGIDQQMRIYLNRGDGTFEDMTEPAGLMGEVGGLNMVHADYDNDGQRDILVLRGGWLQDFGCYPNSLLRNLGKAHFDDVTLTAGLLDEAPCQTAVWVDYDLDGHLDLFLGNETFKSRNYPCRLYHNRGDGTFDELAAKVGINTARCVKGATWGDVNNDGLPDLYISCFGDENQLYINEGEQQGTWRFHDATANAGVAEPRGSFPTWFFDFDNDGWEDILVAPFSGFLFDGNPLPIVLADYLNTPTNADRIHLYRNQHDGTFRDVAPEMKIDKPLLAMGANFGDLDNDGYLDCYFGTGDPHFGTLIPNRMFRNNGGKSFQDVTTSGGFGHVQKGHGIAFADLDNDGDQDVYAVLGGAIAGDVYQNALFENPGHGNHWITLWLRGVVSNRDAIGARIRIHVRSDSVGERDIWVTVGSGGSFGSSSLQQEIGLGDARSIDYVEIHWPNRARTVQRLVSLEVDGAYEIIEGIDVPRVIKRPVLHFQRGSHHHAH